jgi:hypothetical protein
MMDTYQKPYMEQQFPFGQLPQTVPLFEVPQVPSVVAAAVAATWGGRVDVTWPRTGSWEADDETGADELPEQPNWHPFETMQWSASLPQ